MEPVVSVCELQKHYGKTQALKDVTFSVRPGTCFGLLGPNGAGKSTTMKILTGILPADAGTIHILSVPAHRDSMPLRRQIGYVPQNITLYEKLTAVDNLMFFGELYGLHGRELRKRIETVLDEIGLSHRGNEAVETFSGGMKRRINIAAALLHQPKLLILDEPTVGIDPQSRNHIFEMIRALKAQGVTIIYSTHYMEEVEALCDDLAIIDQGQVIAQGSLRDLLSRYGKQAIYVEAKGFETLSDIPHVSHVSSQGQGFILETSRVMEVLSFLLQTASAKGIDIDVLETVRPSLESVFLSLTGTSLRD